MNFKEIIEEESKKEYFKELQSFVDEEYKNKTVFPERKNIFASLETTPYDKVKVAIIGQDPYHGEGEAHGLLEFDKNSTFSFSTFLAFSAALGSYTFTLAPAFKRTSTIWIAGASLMSSVPGLKAKPSTAKVFPSKFAPKRSKIFPKKEYRCLMFT